MSMEPLIWAVYSTGTMALMLMVSSAAAAAEKLGAADSVLSFRRAQITLVDGEKFKVDRIDIADEQIRVYEVESSPTVLIQPRYEETRLMDRSQMVRLEVSKANIGKGVAIGAATGLGVSLLCLYSASNGDIEGADAGFVFVIAAFVSTVGAAIGAVTGSFFHHWETVYDAETGWTEHLGDEYEPGVGYRRKR